MPFPDLLQWIREARRTGTLAVAVAFEERTFRVEQGQVCALGGSDARAHDLVRLVLARGLISEDRLRGLLSAPAEPGPSLRDRLVAGGAVPAGALAAAVRAHVHDAIMQVFLWEDGQFLFAGPSEAALIEAPVWALDVDPPLPIDQLLMDAMRSLDEWRRTREVFSSDYLMVHAIAGATDLPAVQALYDVGEPVALVDLCLRLERPHFDIVGELYEGWRRGLVGVEATPEQLGAGSQERPELGLVEAARVLVDERQYDEAAALLRTVLNLVPSHGGARQLLERVHGEQLAQLYRQFPPYRVPVVAVDRARLDAAALAPRERYLLHRINGRWDVASLTAITPLGELGTLRVLRKLAALGLVALS